MQNYLLNIIKSHKDEKSVGVCSVCSANSFVLEASMIHAKKNNNNLLIETTSNQVDQFGGYTGKTPLKFREMVKNLADSVNFPFEKIILGGDHLGPNVWQNEASGEAMENAETQIREYVKAGFTKIHLDTSMPCAGDKTNSERMLDPKVITERAARLCRIAESTYKEDNLSQLPIYVIGTDVPVPGGALNEKENLRITTPDELEETIKMTKDAFLKFDLDDAWNRTAAVVVQPGVEFSDSSVFNYDRSKIPGLISKIESYDNFVFEAHSTDYQTKHALRQMVEDHFCILKVGPWLTFSFREAVFALAEIEKELCGMKKNIKSSEICSVIDDEMNENPKYWQKHYSGSEEEIKFAKKYSYSDRIRYYWSNKNVDESLQLLLNNLSENKIPLNLLSQYLPEEYDAVMESRITILPRELIHHKIMSVFNKYSYAVSGINN